ncbi:hypothetical protein A9Q98_13300 [Thalassotalea sp. 42_200_T64]|nr:hypothetical protein A9Q98_13300 [Thalassotalea sp. 42_200_T64]
MSPGESDAGAIQRVRIWVDWNGDYVFADNELVSSEIFAVSQMVDDKYTATATIDIPLYAVTDRQINLRIISHYINGADGDAAYISPILSGEVLDYGFEVKFSGISNYADFIASETSLAIRREAVSFTDLSGSETTIQGWNWTFTGGTPASYIGQTPPQVTYNEAGSYPVTLAITDSDSVSYSTTKEQFIKAKLTPVCEADSNWGPYAHISGLTFDQINNIDGNDTDAGYSSYLEDFSTELTVNNTYQLTVLANAGNGEWNDSQRFGVWINWNGNDQFEDSEMVHEEIYIAANQNEEKELTTNITVPVTAVKRATIMRVMVAYNDDSSVKDACATLDSGEFEDYAISVKPIVELSDNAFTLLEGVDDNVNLTINRMAGSTGEVSVSVEIENNNFRIEPDQNSLIWLDGEENSQAITVSFINDDINQSAEDVTLNARTIVDGYTIDEQQVTFTLIDDNNQAPVIELPADFQIGISESVQIIAQVSDADDDMLTLSWAQSSGTSVTLEGATSTTITFNAPANAEVLEFTLCATDKFGVVTESSITVTVTAPAEPTPEPKVKESSGGSLNWSIIILLLAFTSNRRRGMKVSN